MQSSLQWIWAQSCGTIGDFLKSKSFLDIWSKYGYLTFSLPYTLPEGEMLIPAGVGNVSWILIPVGLYLCTGVHILQLRHLMPQAQWSPHLSSSP